MATIKSIEEKAKAYDKALAIARDFYNSTEYAKSHAEVKATYEAIFPELKESEDERVELLNYLYDVHDDDEERARWIAWLEKQGEQKLVENILKDVKKNWRDYFKPQDVTDIYNEGFKDGVVSVKPAWSEEDEKMINHIISDIESLKEQVYCKTLCDEEIVWLKSLSPQKRWKPSEEQIKNLKWLLDNINNYPIGGHSILVVQNLLEQLKSL